MRRKPTSRNGTLRRLLGLGVLLLPAILLLWAASTTSGPARNILWLGTLFQGLATLLALFGRGNLSDPASWPVVMLYVVAFSWLLFGGAGVPAQLRLPAQGVLLCVPLWLFGWMCLKQSGALALREGCVLADRLTRRKHWPADLMQIREMPEVQALRDALTVDASPVFPLLTHARVEARMAGLAALEYRTSWRPGQPQYLLGVVQNATEPEVKAEGLLALACVDDRTVLEPMTECLWDESPLVRQAAADALLWTTDLRWPWIRMALRQALGHPATQHDGAVIREGQTLTSEVVVDLTTWTADKGTLAQRAALTLGVHYDRLLSLGSDPTVIQALQKELTDPHTPAVWRLEIARLLAQYHELSPDVARNLLDGANPAPLRLLAIETMLGKGHNSEAVAALTELARLPNREMALAAAELVQRRLGVDLGLRRGQTLPPVHSRQAAEIVRNVQVWADRQDGRVPVLRSFDDY
jgi:HEAT repeat protein